MGVWSTGLYANDFALDLRSAIGAVLRLPFEPDQLVDALAQTEPGAAHNADDPDHSTFWLVTADQFAKRGIVHSRAREMVLSIIESGADLRALESLGMPAPDLAKRSRILAELKERIVAAQPASKPRAVLKKPQPFLMELGDAMLYPTDNGKPINPYMPPGSKYSNGPHAWTQDGWSAFVVADRGRAFDFLAWYRPVTLLYAHREPPAAAQLLDEPEWMLRLAGTCSPVHYQRIRFQKIGSFPIELARLQARFPKMRPSHSRAVSDISISNELGVWPDPQSGAKLPAWAQSTRLQQQQWTFGNLREIFPETGHARASVEA